jgi:N-acyl amino acid synthase of PEP-CTERM/exosortase system
MKDFVANFNKYFDIVPANTDELVYRSQRLRYQVFCIEQNIFDAKQYADQVEKDEYDQRSAHSLLRHKRTDSVAATVRLVLCDNDNPDALFPIEKHLGARLYHATDAFPNLSRTSLAEISRFSVSKQFRRRPGEAQLTHCLHEQWQEHPTETGRRFYPHITIGLFKAIIQMSLRNTVTHWYSAMEPSLIRLLTRFEIYFIPAGPVVEYYGRRQPCIASVKEIMDRVYKHRRDIWDFVTEDGQILDTI